MIFPAIVSGKVSFQYTANRIQQVVVSKSLTDFLKFGANLVQRVDGFRDGVPRRQLAVPVEDFGNDVEDELPLEFGSF